MKIDPCIRKPWAIPQSLAREYSVKKIERILGFFNRASKGNFYMVDYHEQRLIVGNSVNVTFSGYPRSVITKEGFAFYDQILNTSEKNWLTKMNVEALNIFFDYPESQRYNVEFSYDLIAQAANRREIVLRHRLVPYRLCNNGNLWLGLCFITLKSPIAMQFKATVSNQETGDVYNYINDSFVSCKTGVLNSEEIRILELLSNDVSIKRLCDMLKISESNFKQKKTKIFSKLNVQSWYAAIHQAHELKLV